MINGGEKDIGRLVRFAPGMQYPRVRDRYSDSQIFKVIGVAHPDIYVALEDLETGEPYDNGDFDGDVNRAIVRRLKYLIEDQT